MSAPIARDKKLSGWGYSPVEACDVFRPERARDVREIIGDERTEHLIARGNGRAYGDASLNAGDGVIDATRLDRMLDFDEATGVLHCEAGVGLPELIDHFLPRGWFFPVTPGTKHITIGGAVAADVHGKNHHRDGSLGHFLEELTLMLADGSRVTCSPTSEPDLFHATLGGMGLTGVILDARVRLKRVETAWVKGVTTRTADIDETLENALEGDQRHSYAVTWIDCVTRGRHMGRGVSLRADEAPLTDLPVEHQLAPLAIAPRPPIGVPFRFPPGVLNRASMRLFNAFYYAINRPGSALVNYERYFYPLDAIHHWNRIYGPRGVLQYQIVVPRENARQSMKQVIERITEAKRASFLGVLKTMGERGRGWLSFPLPGLTLSLDFPHTGPDLLQLLHELDDIVLKAGGRVYLAKDACLRAEDVPIMYPEVGRFLELKARIDPHERFSSSLSRRLGLTGAP